MNATNDPATVTSTSSAAAVLPRVDGPQQQAWLDRHAAAVMSTYAAPSRVLVRGEGAWVWDADGRRYLDLLAGIATTSLGHAHPLLVAAVTTQLATLGHVSNVVASPPQVALAERLLALLRAPVGSRVFLCNSGAEAMEAALKLTRRTGRPRVIAAERGFHGRTMGALSLTHNPAYREPFEPLPGGVEHVRYGDVDALAAAMRPAGTEPDVAAVVLEVVQGEGGVRPAPPGYLAAARRLCDDHGALLVLDEVQTGVARTGEWFAHQADDVTPDVVALAKGLGGGIPIGATVAFGEHVAGLLGPGQHGSTFGGNPVSSAAGLAVLHAIERDGLIGSVRQVGEHLVAGVLALCRTEPLLSGIRGRGLLLALELTRPVAAAVAAAALEHGFILGPVGPDAVRLAPPLVLTADQAQHFLDALPAILAAVAAEDRS